MLHGSADASDDANDSEDQKFGAPLAAAGVSAAVAGMGLLGWFGSPWNLAVAMVIAEAGAIAAGWLEARFKGSGLRARLIAALTWSIFGITCTAATAWYAEGRSSMINVELLIPIGIGLVPFLVVRLIVRIMSRKRATADAAPHSRSSIGVAEIALAALVLAVPVAGWGVASKFIGGVQAKATAEVDHTFHALIFEADGHGGVTYEGKAVDRDAIAALCRRAVAAHPDTAVVLRTPKEIDHAALGKVESGAASVGLNATAMPAE